MSELPIPNIHHLSAAIGWLELGNPAEARVELGRIPDPWRDHPDVLAVRWQLAAAQTDWADALRCAEELLRQAPERPSAWLHWAYALRRVEHGGLAKAWEALRPAYDKFPRVLLIPFNLACYAAQSGRLDEAWEWLHKAMEAAGDVQAIKKMALSDPDLELLWPRLREL